MAKDIIIVNTSKEDVQSKAQKAFYKHLQRIEKLKKEVEQSRDLALYFEKQKHDILVTAEKETEALRAEWVRAMYRYRYHSMVKADLREFIEEMIVKNAFELIMHFGHEDLIPLYNDCSETTYEQDKAEADKESADEVRSLFQSMTGMDIDGDINEENMAEHVAKFQEKRRLEQEEQDMKKETRKKTPKQLAAAEQKAKEQELTSKSVREIYLQLVKAFHPDREPDELERLRKTSIMQRVTDAYERNDLPELLRLQLEFEQISLDNIAELADEKLKRYNKVMQEQVKALEEEKNMNQLKINMANPMLSPWIRFSTTKDIDTYMRNEVKDIKIEAKQIENSLIDLVSSPSIAIKYIKEMKKDNEAFDNAPDFSSLLDFFRK